MNFMIFSFFRDRMSAPTARPLPQFSISAQYRKLNEGALRAHSVRAKCIQPKFTEMIFRVKMARRIPGSQSNDTSRDKRHFASRVVSVGTWWNRSAFTFSLTLFQRGSDLRLWKRLSRGSRIDRDTVRRIIVNRIFFHICYNNIRESLWNDAMLNTQWSAVSSHYIAQQYV